MENINLQKGKPTVLIVEDDFDSQEFLRILLSPKFVTRICDGENSFYSIIENNKIDAIIMDISLRGKKSGLDLIREVKNSRTFGKIPILCFTAHAFGNDRINALTAGADTFLAKPVNNKILLNTLESLMTHNHEVFV